MTYRILVGVVTFPDLCKVDNVSKIWATRFLIAVLATVDRQVIAKCGHTLASAWYMYK